MVICLEQGADLHMAQIAFTFLVLAHLGSPGKRAVKRCVCVCVCVCVCLVFLTHIVYIRLHRMHGVQRCDLLLVMQRTSMGCLLISMYRQTPSKRIGLLAKQHRCTITCAFWLHLVRQCILTSLAHTAMPPFVKLLCSLVLGF